MNCKVPQKPKIIITTNLPNDIEHELSLKCEIIFHWKGDTEIPLNEFKKIISECDGIFCVYQNSYKFDSSLLDNAKNLKVISTMSVGVDHIDLNACQERGIRVCNTPLDRLTETTADLVLALLLATARRIPEATCAVKNGEWPLSWQPFFMCGKDIYSSTIGIIGLGAIGQAVAKRLHGFSAQIMYSGRTEKVDFAKLVNAKFVPLDELLEKSDFVIPLCKLTKETENLLGMKEFKKMKKDSILINVSRGGVINQNDLIDALQQNIIGGCGLDVTTPEPLPTDNLLLTSELKSKVVITPHIGSGSIETRTLMARTATENLILALCGLPSKYTVLK